MKYELKLGDNAETLKEYPDDYFDSIVTDPPYGIEFLGKDWDKNTGVMETWHECYRVLKPGGHILAFSAARTYHNLATNIESAGFEIRDQLMWLYGSGFPKAQDIGKAIDKRELENDWHGWKTALKPAHEPIVMARKPFKGSCIDNVLKHGVGAMNIDESRVSYADEKPVTTHSKKAYKSPSMAGEVGALETHSAPGQELGRYPSNVIGEIPEYQNYFYSPKVSRKERHIGFEQENVETFSRDKTDGESTVQILRKRDEKNLNHIVKRETGIMNENGTESAGYQGLHKLAKTKKNLDHIPVVKRDDSRNMYVKEPGRAGTLSVKNHSLGNNHPTVKPVELMKYLIKLVTPKGGKVLDPFNGSGSTGMACVELDYEYTGCELDPEYIDIATKRIEGWYEHTRPETQYDDLFDE